MKLFDIVDLMFTDYQKYMDTVTDMDKKRYAFIINRMLGIGYPKHANFYNSSHVDKSSLVDVWAYNFSLKNHKAKFWWLTKIGVQPTKSILHKIKTEVLNKYKLQYNISTVDFNTLVDMFPTELMADIAVFKSQLK